MPKIKNPISASERLYNLRYDREEQRKRLNAIQASGRSKYMDSFARRFLENMDFLLSAKSELTEAQADFLADLYSKYSD